MQDTKRNQSRAVAAGFLTALVGMAMVGHLFVPGLALDDVNFTTAFFGLLLVAAGITVMAVYMHRLSAPKGMLRDERELVHWKYDRHLWRSFVEAEYAEEQSMKTGLFLFGSGVAIVVGLALTISDAEAGPIMAATVLALITLMGTLAYVVPRWNHSIYKSHPGEAVISEKAVYLGGRLHTWDLAGCRLVAVELRQGPYDVIEIAYTPGPPIVSSRAVVPQIELVKVPVPPGEEAAAKMVVEILGKQTINPPPEEDTPDTEHSP